MREFLLVLPFLLKGSKLFLALVFPISLVFIAWHAVWPHVWILKIGFELFPVVLTGKPGMIVFW